MVAAAPHRCDTVGGPGRFGLPGRVRGAALAWTRRTSSATVRATGRRPSLQTEPTEAPSPPRLVLVVPCYNEQHRIRIEPFVRCVDGSDGVVILFVDDGSTDGTRAMLEDACRERADSMRVMSLPVNAGKGAAVRAGVREASGWNPELIGYWDADLATPLDELPLFLEALATRPTVDLVLGSRVKLLGRTIDRRMSRHYIGRVFATLASMALRLAVYDTQCGAKVFRARPEVLEAFAEPFRARWIFDVEILARLGAIQRRDGGPGLEVTAYELPLRTWSDVEGSKVGPLAYVTATRDLVRIYRADIAGERTVDMASHPGA